MLKTLFLILTVLTIFVASGPVSCESGSRNMGSLLEVDDAQTLKTGSWSNKRPVAPVAPVDPCKDKDVCRFECKNLPQFSTCTKTAYFVDFLNFATGTKHQISQTYIDVCVKRTTKGETNWLNPILRKYRTYRNKQERYDEERSLYDLRQRLDQYFNSGSPRHVYLAHMIEVLLAFQKLCSQNPGKFCLFHS
jgi:hypothetical protein